MQKGVLRKRPPSQLSEYGRQLKEKQELKKHYNLREYQLKAYVSDAFSHVQRKSANAAEIFVQSLETRLDSFVFRMGMAETRNQARQLASHGHFLVNGKRITIPSYKVKKGDVVQIRPSSLEREYFKQARLRLKKYEAPSWISLDKEKMEGTIVGLPSVAEANLGLELPIIFEYYSR
ncbi:MAG: 30S ribosomal protein S4 [bacterium]|nr:30S ribosomal protein S4 [bacterium]